MKPTKRSIELDHNFIREYCEKYGIETSPGPGAPRLNGVNLTGHTLRSIFTTFTTNEGDYHA